MNRPWTTGEIRRVRHRLRTGEPIESVMEDTSRSRAALTECFLRLGERLGDHLKAGHAVRRAEAVELSRTRPVQEVAAEFGVSPRTLTRWRQGADIRDVRATVGKRRRKVAADLRTRALSWRMNGESYTSIAERLDVSKQGARRLVLAEALRVGVDRVLLRRSP